jgi:hypothetical protein
LGELLSISIIINTKAEKIAHATISVVSLPLYDNGIEVHVWPGIYNIHRVRGRANDTVFR